MKVKSYFLRLLLLMAFVVPWVTQAQAQTDNLTVYDGTASIREVPAYIYYFGDYTRSQHVIPATDLVEMTGGTITSITYYTTSSNIPYTTLSTVDVYLTEVASTSISAFVPKSSCTAVYSGTLQVQSVSGGGLLTIQLATPYVYGGGNLLVGIENTTDAGFKSIYFYGRTVNGASVAGYNSSSLSGVSASQKNFLPKTTFTYIPAPVSCPKPATLDYSNLTATSVDLAWTAGGSETSWTVSVSDGNTTNDYVVTSTSYSLTSLNANTDYTVAVRAICGVGDTSFPRTVSFHTLCGGIAVLPWSEGFDAMATGSSTSGAPECWGILDANDGTYPYIYVNTSSTYVHSGSKSLYFQSSNIRYGYAVFPKFDAPLNTLQISFYVNYEEPSSSGYLTVGYMTDAANASSFVPLYTCSDRKANKAWTYEEDILLNDIPASVASTARLAFRYGGGSSNNYYMGIDDIVVKNIPNCFKPANITLSDLSNTGVTVSWDTPAAGNIPTNYVIAWGTGTDPDAMTNTQTLSGSTMSYAITGLTANTDYNVFVKSICSATEESEWSLMKSVHTYCDNLTTLPYTYGFEDAATGSSSSPVFDAECWTRLNNGTQYMGYPYISSSSNYCHTGSRGLYWTNSTSSTYGDYQCLVLPGVDATVYSVNTLRLKFWAKATSSSYHPVFQVGVMTDPSDINSFQLVQTVNVEGTTWKEYKANLNGYTGTGNYVAVKAVRPSSTWYASVDDFTLQAVTCFEPTAVAANNVTSNSAVISWTAPANAPASYILAYGTGNNPDDMTPITVSGTSYSLSGLNDYTTYHVYVKSVCSSTDSSDWTEAYTFTTQRVCPNVTNVVAENVSVVGATITWSKSADAQYAPTYYNVTCQKASDGTPVIFDQVSDTTFTLSNLDAVTEYHVTVEPVCGTHGTGNSASVNFTTNSLGCAEYDLANVFTSEIGLGSTSSSNYTLPVNNYFKNTFSEQLILASELNGAGVLQSIQFQAASTISSKNNCSIYVGTTSLSSISYNSYEALENLTLVYTGSMNCTSGWKTFEFNQNTFSYDGTSNLVIAVVDNSEDYNGQSSKFYTHSATGKAMAWYSDNYQYPNSSMSKSDYGYRNNMKLEFAPCTRQLTCAAPSASVSNVDDHNITVSWNPGYHETAWKVEHRLAGNEEWIEDVASTTNRNYTISGLNNITEYQVRITSLCTEDPQSVVLNVTTACGIFELPFSEDFAYDLNSCWDKDDVWGTTNYGFTGKHYKMNVYSSNAGAMVTPSLHIVDTVELSFDVAATAYNGNNAPTSFGTDDRFVVYAITDNDTTEVAKWDANTAEPISAIPNTGMRVSLPVADYAGQNVRFAFYGESTVSNADWDLHIGNIEVLPLHTYNVEAHAPYTWMNDTTYSYVVNTAAQPDSIVNTTYMEVANYQNMAKHVLHLTMHPAYQLIVNQEICQRDSVELFGSYYKTTGNYTKSGLTAMFGADSTITLNLQVHPAPTAAIYYNGEATELISGYCDNADLTLTARSNATNATFAWEDASTTAARTVNPHENNTYTVVATEATYGCTSLPASVVVSTTPVADLTITATDSVVCAGEPTTLTVADNSGLDVTYRWNTGATTASITVNPTEATTYSVTATVAGSGCTTTAEYTVGVNPLPVVAVSTSSDEICLKDAITLNATEVEGYSYIWNNNADLTSASQEFVPAAAGNFTYTVNVTDANGCVNNFTTNSVAVHPSYEMNDEKSACIGMLPYTWGTQSLEEAGSYDQTFTIAYGCDSLVHLNFIVEDTAVNNYYQEVCEGANIIFGEDQYQMNFAAAQTIDTSYIDVTSGECPARHTLHLTVNHPATNSFTENVCDTYTWNGVEYTETGNYDQTLATTKGCDSTVTLTLTVRKSTTGIDVQDVCDQLVWKDGNTYTEPNLTATFDTVNVAGCDSVITLNLTTVRTKSYGVDDNLWCESNSFTWMNGRTYTMNETEGNITYLLPGMQNAAGCDTLAVLNLVFNLPADTLAWADTSACDIFMIDTVACDGTIGERQITVDGDYVLPTPIANNQYVISRLHVTIKKSSYNTTFDTACVSANDPYIWTINTPTGLYNVDTIVPVANDTAITYNVPTNISNGCSSIEVLRLHVYHPTKGVEYGAVCVNGTYESENGTMFYGNNYLPGDTTVVIPTTTTDANGCNYDSTLVLTVNPVYNTTATLTLCESQFVMDSMGKYTYTYNDPNHDTNVVLAIPGALNQEQYSNTVSAEWHTAAGCDSTVTVNYTVNPTVFVTEIVDTCYKYTWSANNETYTTFGQTFDTVTLTQVNGCDSIVYLNLTLNDTAFAYDTVLACTKYIGPDGKEYRRGQTFRIEMGTSESGCDSVQYLTYEVRQSVLVDQYVVSTDPYTWADGNVYTRDTDNVYFNYPIGDNCDSTLLLHFDMVDPIVLCDNQMPYNTGINGIVIENYSVDTFSYCGNGVRSENLGTGGGPLSWGIRLPINNPVTEYTLQGAQLYFVNSVNNFQVGTCEMNIYTGGESAPQTLVGTKSLTFTDTDVTGWKDFVLDTPVSVDSQIVWITFSTNDVDYPAAFVDEPISTADPFWISIDGSPWDDIRMHGFDGPAMIKAVYSTNVWRNNDPQGNDTILYYTVNKTSNTTDTLVKCDSYVWDDTTITTTGIYTKQYTSINGCDSNVTLNLTINHADTTATFDTTVCDSYTWHGNTYTTDTTVAFDTLTVNGCDSTITLNLVVKNQVAYTDVHTACDSYEWHGMVYTASNDTAHFDTIAANGCDSITTLNLTINKSKVVLDSLVVNTGSYRYRNVLYIAPFDSTIVSNDTTVAGCDSTTHFHLIIPRNLLVRDSAYACGTYTWDKNGHEYEWIDRAANNYALYRDVTDNRLIYTNPMDTVYENEEIGLIDHINVLFLSLGQAAYGADTIVRFPLSQGILTLGENTLDFSSYTADAVVDTVLSFSNPRYCDSLVSYHINLVYNFDTLYDTVCAEQTEYEFNGHTYSLGTGASSGTNTVFSCGFDESDDLSNWTIVDADGDGHNWMINPGILDSFAHSGSNFMISESFSISGFGTLFPDNWLISPAITIPNASSALTWFDRNYLGWSENYSVYISTTGNDTTDFTTSLYNGIANERDNYVERTVDLSAYAGQTVNIAFRHHNSPDNYILFIDDISITSDQVSDFTFTENIGTGDSMIVTTMKVHRLPAITGTEDTVACDSINWNGQTYTATGVYTDTLTSVLYGCDSVVTLNLTVNNATHNAFTEVACGSYEWNDQTYTVSDTYTYNYTNADNCASVDTLHLTINPVYNDTVEDNVCLGGTYTWEGNIYTGEEPADVITDTVRYTTINGCDSIITLQLTVNVILSDNTTDVACGSYTWQGRNYSVDVNDANAVIKDTISFTTANGCDSICTLNLTLNAPTTGDTTAVVCDYFNWYGNPYNISGDYEHSLTNAAGCDSTITLHLTVNHSDTTATANVTACDSYVWNGQTYTESGEYPFSTQTVNGCDSLITLTLTINKNAGHTDTVVACDKYDWNTHEHDVMTYLTSGNYYEHYTDVNGCASIDTLSLTINKSTNETLDPIYSSTGSLVYNNVYYGPVPGLYTVYDTLVNAAGCDSITSIVLHVGDASQAIDTVISCHDYTWRDGNTYVWISDEERAANGNALYKNQTTGAYVMYNPTYVAQTETFDSVYLLVLTLTENFATSQDTNYPVTFGTISLGDSIFDLSAYNKLDQADTTVSFLVHFHSDYYCDSAVTFNVNLKNNYVNVPDTHICVTETSFSWRGQTLNVATTEYDTIHTYMMKDTLNAGTQEETVEYINVIQHPLAYATERREACDSYTWNGNTYTESTSGAAYVIPNGSVYGCDSTVTLILNIYHNTSKILAPVTACDSYTWTAPDGDNRTYTESATDVCEYYATYEGTSLTCLSYDTLVLVVNHADTLATEDVTMCDSYTWHGTTYTTSGSYAFDTTTVNGCDSTVTLNLTINNKFEDTVTLAACDSLVWDVDGITYTTSGTYTYNDTTVNGCDSIITLVLTINNRVDVDTLNYTACDSYVWNGETYTESGIYTISGTTAAGCDSTAVLNLTVNNSEATDTTAVACLTYDWHGNTYTASGDYVDTMQTVNSCDSIVTLHLTIGTGRTFDRQIVTNCGPYTWIVNNDTVEVFTESAETSTTFVNPNTGCDSTIYLQLTINKAPVTFDTVTVCYTDLLNYEWEGFHFNVEAGATMDTAIVLPYSETCDSTKNLHLIVDNNQDVVYTETICHGLGYKGHGFDITADSLAEVGEHEFSYEASTPAGCTKKVILKLTVSDVLTEIVSLEACDSLMWHDVMYYESSDDIEYKTVTAAGCDSIANLHLTINNSAHNQPVNMTVCDSYIWNANNYTVSGTYTNIDIDGKGCQVFDTLVLTVNYSDTTGAETATACDSYSWNGTEYTESGVYTFANQTVFGCDSLTTLTLTVNYSDTTVTETFAACDSYEWNGQTYTESGVYTYSDTTINGCDSLVTLTLTVSPSYNTTIDTTVCGVYVWDNRAYETSGTYYYTYQTAAGCDSAFTLNLTVNQSVETYDTVETCIAYIWNGITYNQSGNYSQRFANAAGCDSTVYLTLTVNQPVSADTTAIACDNFTWHGTTYTSTGNYTYTGTTAEGCDSTVTLHLTLHYSNYTGAEQATACDSYDWKGFSYTESGSYTYSTSTADGCDSTVTLYLTINHSDLTATETQTACESYFWNGQTYTESGVYTFANQTVRGCDSLTTLTLTINNGTHNVSTVTNCGSYTWNGQTYATSGNYTYNYTNANGCASTDTLHLTVNSSTTATETFTACDSYTWHGNTYTTSGTQTYTTTNANGCDSIITLNLTINHSTSGTDVQTACDSYTWRDGIVYTASTNTPTFTLQNAAGCDSVITLHLTVNHSTTGTETQSACDSYTWNGQTYTTSGNYTYSTTNAAGCDSTATLILTINHSVQTTETVTANGPYTWNGNVYTATGTYTYTGTTAAGCDSIATLNLTFTPFVITAVANDNTLGTVTGGGNYYADATATLTATPAANARFVAWNDGDTNATRVITVTGDATYIANFAYLPVNVTLVVSDAAMGTTNPAPGAYTYEVGAPVMAQAVPAAGHLFSNWTVSINGESTTVATNPISVTIPAAYAGASLVVIANFVSDTFDVTVLSNSDVMGTVTGSGRYVYGENATITAMANSGYEFLGWNDGDTNATRTVLVTGDVTYTAMFGLDMDATLTATANNADWGYVLINGVRSDTYVGQIGDEVTVEAYANEGYRFVNWDDQSTSFSRTVVLTENVMSMIANFEVETIGIDEVEDETVIIYAESNRIIVRGAENKTVRVFDVVGRLVAQRTAAGVEEVFNMPNTGIYLIKVDNAPARRVVVRP